MQVVLPHRVVAKQRHVSPGNGSVETAAKRKKDIQDVPPFPDSRFDSGIIQNVPFSFLFSFLFVLPLFVLLHALEERQMRAGNCLA